MTKGKSQTQLDQREITTTLWPRVDQTYISWRNTNYNCLSCIEEWNNVKQIPKITCLINAHSILRNQVDTKHRGDMIDNDAEWIHQNLLKNATNELKSTTTFKVTKYSDIIHISLSKLTWFQKIIQDRPILINFLWYAKFSKLISSLKSFSRRET